MKKILHIILFLISNNINSFACDCPPISTFEERERNYHAAELVLLAKEINTIDNIQKIEVLEVLKGQINKRFLSMKSIHGNCSLHIHGVWLIYGVYNADSTISSTICTASRSLEGGTLPEPPYLFSENNKIENLNNILSFHKYELTELRNLFMDIELYRGRKKTNIKASETNDLKYYLFGLTQITE